MKAIEVYERSGLDDCEWSSLDELVLWRGKVVKRFTGPDAKDEAAGYARASAELRIRTSRA